MTASAPQTLQHDDIARRIPHQGSMCLLDCVTHWSDDAISCKAISHRATDNPLRACGRLGAACGIEYAAQAMALHGALVAESAEDSFRPTAGYLVSVRSVMLQVDRLDDQPTPLTVCAGRLSGDSRSVLYSFSIHAGPELLVEGRAAVMLDASPPDVLKPTHKPIPHE